MRYEDLRIVFAVAALAFLTGPAPLQGQTLLRPASAGYSTPADSTVDPDARLWQRYISATVVGAAGAVTLGTIGAQAGRRCDGGCSDIEGLAETMLGIFIGGTIGSAIGAAMPRGRGLCTGSQRFGRALAGASLGLAAGIGLFLVPPLEAGFIITIPVGSVLFMRKC